MTSPSYMPGAVEPTGFITTTQPPKRRGRWVWLAVGAVGVVIIVAAAVLLLSGRSFDATGSLMFTKGCGYAGSGGYADVRAGAPVTVKDSAGKTLALGQLGTGKAEGKVCRFDFTVGGVPSGEEIYGIEVGRRGVVQYTEDQMREPIVLSLGS